MTSGGQFPTTITSASSPVSCFFRGMICSAPASRMLLPQWLSFQFCDMLVGSFLPHRSWIYSSFDLDSYASWTSPWLYIHHSFRFSHYLFKKESTWPERQRDSEGEIFHLLVLSPLGNNSHTWARYKRAARNSTLILQVLAEPSWGASQAQSAGRWMGSRAART